MSHISTILCLWHSNLWHTSYKFHVTWTFEIGDAIHGRSDNILELSTQLPLPMNLRNTHGFLSWHMRQSLMASQTKTCCLWCHEATCMHIVFHSNFAGYIVCRRNKLSELLSFCLDRLQGWIISLYNYFFSNSAAANSADRSDSLNNMYLIEKGYSNG